MTILFLLKGYPRLSETFIAQEIRGLEQRGLDIALVSLRFPTDKQTHPIVMEIKAPVRYLPEYLHQESWRVLKSWWKARNLAGYKSARRQWLKDFARDMTCNRIRRFGQALVLAAEMPPNITHLHAHFLHTPAAVAYYTHLMTGIGWTCSAHAKDIWTIPEWEKVEKLRSLNWLVTCTRSGFQHLQELAPDPKKVNHVYHGIDFTRFPAPDDPKPDHQKVTILSVGRLVPKKGYDDLLAALAQIPETFDWEFRHIGGGPLAQEMEEKAAVLGIDQKITWLGAQAQEKVLAEYRKSDLFVLASKIAEDGDRDGLPNVLMEAQSQRLATIATNISGIPELIQDQVTGILVPAQSPKQLAEAIADLIKHPDKRKKLAQAGFKNLREHFSHARGIDDLEKRFRAL